MNIEEEINGFIQFILEGEKVADVDKLITRLDNLAVLLPTVNYIFDGTDYPEPPNIEYRDIRRRVKKNFPSLGYYYTVLEVLEPNESVSPVVGDAIDDVTDIVKDLMEVSWYFQNTSANDALWHFENSYNSHWGRHLRELQLYLHVYRH